jgi:hypothetical protein
MGLVMMGLLGVMKKEGRAHRGTRAPRYADGW